MRVELQNEEHCRYLRVYHYYRNLILSGQMKSETKLPSIRKGANELQMSRTTMENAYMLLAAEGYIVSRPQSGYYVTDIAEKQEEGRKIASRHVRKQENPVVYDFATSNVDKESFRFELWRRYMKSAMRQDERLLSYGEPQGEQEFREVLSEYIQKTRSVICSPDQIVIGAGIQSLLHILCPLNHKKRTVFFRDSEFVQGMTVFEDHNYRIAGSAEEEIGMYYVSPSQMTRFGGVMPIQERLELVGRAEKEHFLIIEDDYNSEFKYFQKPVPSLQGLSGGRNVIYLGTFSKMLLPSIRISYMILPPELMETYEKRKNNYNQTASKAEQIALTQFIRDGHLASQVRKSRKIHLAKAEKLAESIHKVFEDTVNVKIGEAGFMVQIIFSNGTDVKKVAKAARKEGLTFREAEGHTLLLTCAGVESDKYEEAMQILAKCVIIDNMK